MALGLLLGVLLVSAAAPTWAAFVSHYRPARKPMPKMRADWLN